MKSLFLTILVSVCAVAAAADTVAYKCNIRGARANEWIQPLIFIAHDRSSGRIVVSDAVILGFNDGQPVDARLIKDNGARTTFAWDVEVTLRVSPVRMRYRGTYIKSSGQFSVIATPAGYQTNFTKGGSCSVDRLNS